MPDGAGCERGTHAFGRGCRTDRAAQRFGFRDPASLRYTLEQTYRILVERVSPLLLVWP
jgi:hypothetical protein